MGYQKFHTKTNKGFTLLEVMIALVIFSLAAITLMTSDRKSIHQTQYLKEKVLAAQVADEYLNRFFLNNRKKIQNSSINISYFGLNWNIKQVVQLNEQLNMNKLTIDITLMNNKTNNIPLFTLITFLRGSSINEI